MDFASLILFLVIFYIRPQEWMGLMANLHPVDFVMIFALFGLLVRHRGLTLSDIVRTPHDWVMFGYLGWIVYAAEDHWRAFGQVQNLLIVYIVIVQALSELQRVERFLLWWTIMLLIVAGLAVAIDIGFDPTGSYDLTYGYFRGRLALNTSMTHNPNSLAHTVVPVVALTYFLWFWRRPIFVKEVAVVVMMLPLWCLYKTASKGSYIAGFAAVVAGMMFGRSRFVQVLVLALALTVGWRALQQLPRMESIAQMHQDEGIAGRRAAFEFGLEKLEDGDRLGYMNFQSAFFREHGYHKASHSSYVQIGAELGYPGLFLFLGVMYCCLRTLVTARCESVNEERAQRMLFVLVVSFMLSSWLIDFALRFSFYLIAATTAAFHRHLMLRTRKQEAPASQQRPEAKSPEVTQEPVAAPPAPVAAQAEVREPVKASAKAAVLTVPAPGINWRRLGWVDVALMWGLMWVTIRTWHYVLSRI